MTHKTKTVICAIKNHTTQSRHAIEESETITVQFKIRLSSNVAGKRLTGFRD